MRSELRARVASANVQPSLSGGGFVIAARLDVPFHLVVNREKSSRKSVAVMFGDRTVIATLVEYGPDVNTAVCVPTSLSVGVHENVPVVAVNVAVAIPEKVTSAASCVDSFSAVTVKVIVFPA